MLQLALILSTIEVAINRYFKLDKKALVRLKDLDNNVICLHITGLDIRLYFLPDQHGIQVLGEYASDPDVTIHGSPMALIRLGASKNKSKTLLDTDAYIEGDMGVANHFTNILKSVDLDWQEHLSHLVGDIITHQTASVIDQSKGWLDDTHHAMINNATEYMSEESKVLVTEAELSHYLDDVDTLHADMDRIEARVNRLKQSQKNQD
ncbi:MAG: SCP2 sterol-binding domain-containing protein [Thiotrichaceae bacterium]|nr:SCP2 sterol-binding domain-containing protein [Thiotrichaceae bacterium]